MIQNLIDMDTVKTSRIQVQRRSNLQNQKFLRLQMKQKEDNDVFSSHEKKAHVDVYDQV